MKAALSINIMHKSACAQYLTVFITFITFQIMYLEYIVMASICLVLLTILQVQVQGTN